MGRPKSANSLEWMGEMKMLTWILDHRFIILTAMRDHPRSLIADLRNYLLLPSTWITFKVLETAQLPFFYNKLFLCRMYLYLSIALT